MRHIPTKTKYLAASIAVALLTCFSQIRGSTILVLGCLGTYMLLAGVSCSYDFTLPILLFFLPWSPILRTDPTSFSFYTFGMVLVCFISAVKKRFSFRSYQIVAGVLLIFLTLLAKLLHGSGLSFDYISFIMMIVLFPMVRDEMKSKKYDFYQVVVFFSLGIILASLCALFFADSANIRRFIKVDSWAAVIRRSGFYRDANFYTAQVLAALGGALALVLREVKKGRLVFLFCIILFLLYCGFLSGSKSFVLVVACLLVLWIIAVAKMRSRTGLKITLLIALVMTVIYIATSVMFSDLISVMLTRFSSTRDLDTFTTGRTELWAVYLKEIFGGIKVFFFGQGFTNVKINDRSSHNTLIQILYQFGVLGAPVLFYWVRSYFRTDRCRKRRDRLLDLNRFIVLVGTFLPWLAIDILFFDEFFLLQWYMFAALHQADPAQAANNTTGLYGGSLWTKE